MGGIVSQGLRAIPLLSFGMPFLTMPSQFLMSTLLAGLLFFLISILKSLALRKPIFLAGLRTLMTGGAAASLAYFSAYFIQAFFQL